MNIVLWSVFVTIAFATSRTAAVCQNPDDDACATWKVCDENSKCSGQKIECDTNSSCNVKCNGNNVCNNMIINGEEASKVNVIFESASEETTTHNIRIICPTKKDDDNADMGLELIATDTNIKNCAISCEASPKSCNFLQIDSIDGS